MKTKKRLSKYQHGGKPPTKKEIADAATADYYRKQSGQLASDGFTEVANDLPSMIATGATKLTIKGVPMIIDYADNAMSKAGIKAVDYFSKKGIKPSNLKGNNPFGKIDNNNFIDDAVDYSDDMPPKFSSSTKTAAKKRMDDINTTDYAPGSKYPNKGFSPEKAKYVLKDYDKPMDIYGMFDNINFPYTPFMNKYGGRVGKGLPKKGFGGVAQPGLQGAAIGAQIGSAIPGVGTAIGAGAGFLVGGTFGYFADEERQKQLEEQRLLERENLQATNLATKPIPMPKTNDPYAVQYRYGGRPTPQFLAEGGETIDGQGVMTFAPNSSVGENGRIHGDSHEAASGGVPMSGGERIYSDSIKSPSGKTYADDAAKVKSKVSKLEKKLANTSDPISSFSIKKMLSKHQGHLDTLFQGQEDYKSEKVNKGMKKLEMKYGGNLPKYQWGTTVPDKFGGNAAHLNYQNPNALGTYIPFEGQSGFGFNDGTGFAGGSGYPQGNMPAEYSYSSGQGVPPTYPSVSGAEYVPSSTGEAGSSYAAEYLPGLLASNVGNIYDLYQGAKGLKNPYSPSFGRVGRIDPSLINLNTTRNLGQRAITEERAAADYNIRGGSSSAGQYLSSRSALGVGAGKAKADFLAKIGELEYNTNAGIKNDVNSRNAMIEGQNIGFGMEEERAGEMGKARNQEAISRGLHGIGNQVGKYNKEILQSKQQDELFSSIGTDQYEWEVITDNKGKKRRVLVPKNS